MRFINVLHMTIMWALTRRSRAFLVARSATSTIITNRFMSKELEEQIKLKGDQIRQLKSDGIAKEALEPHIAELLALKAQLPVNQVTTTTTTTPNPAKPKKQSSQKQQRKNEPQPELSSSELRQIRLQKVQAMRDAGVNPFEYTFEVSHTAAQLSSLYHDKLDPGQEDSTDTVISTAGRILTRRVFGKLAFFTIQDETGILQLQLDQNRLAENFQVSTRWNIFVFPASCAIYLTFVFLDSQRLDRCW